MYRKIQMFSFFLLTALLIAAPPLRAGTQTDSTFHIDKTINIKGDYYYPPFEFINENGQPDGFNVELFKRLAEELGIQYKLELGPWHQVREELENGEIDALLGLMVSEERSKKVKFSIPHSVMTHGIFTREDQNIKNLEQLRNKEIIVQKKDLMHDFLINTGLTDKIIAVENQHRALNLLSSGKHEAALIGNFQGAHLINKHNIKNIIIQNSKIEPKKYAMAVSKDNDELLWLLNMGLYQLKASGEYDEIYEKWFGVYEKKSFFKRFRLPIIVTISGLAFLIIMVIFLRHRIKKA
ncbi:MAG: transporter substrate-binding domain-containing protein, partial [Prolixibacteraceae bacterium]|nr:transporter substrate-binding domain-containing protein [Prolixibacteraceae bacterium]